MDMQESRLAGILFQRAFIGCTRVPMGLSEEGLCSWLTGLLKCVWTGSPGVAW